MSNQLDSVDLEEYYQFIVSKQLTNDTPAGKVILNIIGNAAEELAICAKDISNIMLDGTVDAKDIPYFISLLNNVLSLVNKYVSKDQRTKIDELKRIVKFIASYIIINIQPDKEPEVRKIIYTLWFTTFDSTWNMAVGAFAFVKAQVTGCFAYCKPKAAPVAEPELKATKTESLRMIQYSFARIAKKHSRIAV